MKHQALFSLKDKSKIKCHMLLFCLALSGLKVVFLELKKYKCGTKMQLNSPDL